MARLAGIHRLPIELIERALTQLDLKLLLRASHVCHTWRLIAVNDPLYWRNIAIHDISPATLDFATVRLEAGRGRPDIRFEIDYRLQGPEVERRLLPLLALALPRARVLVVRMESFYRLQIQKILASEAKCLKEFHLLYDCDPRPEIILELPLASNLFARKTGKLREVRLRDIILPSTPIAAFHDVEEVWWLHGMDSHQHDFPCYLFDFFPKMKRLRMSGGEVWFANAPLPKAVVDAFSQLTWVDIEVREASQSAFFRHLPMHAVPEAVITGPEFDAVYDTLEPLRSHFHLAFTNTYPGEFYISVKGQSELVRHFSEAYSYYAPGSTVTNCIFQDDAFFSQLGALQIQVSLWALLLPQLPSLIHLSKLIVEIDDERPVVATLPDGALLCPHLDVLVIQVKPHFARVAIDDVLDFVDRITTARVALELRRVLVEGERTRLEERFESIDYSLDRYSIVSVPSIPVVQLARLRP